MQQRNNVISICKGIAIILMVIGHAETQATFSNFIYLFHMPIFFITAGYFFSRKYLDDPWTFVKKRFKGLYVPMVKWSVFFLLIHNLCFKVGILNEQFGNWKGGVTHPYDLHKHLQNLVTIFTAMGGYDEFLAGAFWFFRALLITSILFLVLYLLLEGSRWKWLKGSRAVVTICLLTLVFTFVKVYYGLKVSTIIQGGLRELQGLFFFGAGVLYRTYEPKLKENWGITLLCFGLLLGAAIIHLQGMTLTPDLITVITLPVTGILGFLMVHHISKCIDRHDNFVKRFLVYCGNMTLYIFVFHIISFKVVSALQIWCFNLEWGRIGSHMVVHHETTTSYFWVLYTIAGVGLPLLWMWAYRGIKNKYFLKNK